MYLEVMQIKTLVLGAVFSLKLSLPKNLFPTAPASGCKTWPREEWSLDGWRRPWFSHSLGLLPDPKAAHTSGQTSVPSSMAPGSTHGRAAPPGEDTSFCHKAKKPKGKSIRKKQYYLQRYLIQVYVEWISHSIRLNVTLVKNMGIWGSPEF